MSEGKHSSVLVICRSAPFQSSRLSAALDYILTAASFDQKVTVLFIGDGLYALLPQQETGEKNMKNPSLTIPAFELYGVDKVIVDEQEVAERNIDSQSLVTPVYAMSKQAIRDLVQSVEKALVF